PDSDGEMGAAERLGRRDKKWADVWERFAESPDLYPHLPGRLRAARPHQTGLFDPSESWPQDNERLEGELREELLKLPNLNPADARAALHELEQKHGCRRGWVWATLKQAPLCFALSHLAEMARATEKPPSEATAEGMAEAY